ncbi:MAG: hypothetical protein ACLTF5_08495 [Butyricicoccus sp.]
MKVACTEQKDPSEIIFTGGGSQADNLAIRGYVEPEASSLQDRTPRSPLHLRHSRRKAIRSPISVDAGGHRSKQLKSVITDPTALVTMAANSEIGTIQNLNL